MKRFILLFTVMLVLLACSSNIAYSSKYNVSENEEYIFAWAEDVTFAKALHKCKENICLYYGYVDKMNSQEKWMRVETSVFNVEIVDRFQIRDTERRCVSIKISKSKNKHLIKRE